MVDDGLKSKIRCWSSRKKRNDESLIIKTSKEMEEYAQKKKSKKY